MIKHGPIKKYDAKIFLLHPIKGVPEITIKSSNRLRKKNKIRGIFTMLSNITPLGGEMMEITRINPPSSQENNIPYVCQLTQFFLYNSSILK